MSDIRQLFVARDRSNNLYVEYVIDDLQRTLENLEYGDVRDGEFQIWEYPSGKIYNIVSDRELKGEKYKDYYGSPDPNVWLPKLQYVSTDKVLVHREYKRFRSLPERPSLFRRLRSFFQSKNK